MCNVNLGACGLNCDTCGARIAYLTNDDAVRIKTAKEWSEMFKVDIDPKTVNCVGCMMEGDKFCHCAECQIRKCVVEHNIKHCGECESFACETIQGFLNMAPEAKANLAKYKK